MMLRLLNAQGIAGIAVSLSLAILLAIQGAESRHWKKQSGQFEQLYRAEQASFATTVANYRAAAERARADDLAAAQRVAAQQNSISQRSENDLEARIADARDRAERLRVQPQAVAANPGGRAAAAMPRVSAAAHGVDQAAGKDRLPDALTATEQAIQLDELIKWVKVQHAVDVNGH